MENLNDAEFGSNKDQEEAPILVAQRYLNIFRQIHIFSKEKRDQFDDELLALPQNILDFYKRMPGGRLLFEHIEDVKTARGISFVKMNKDDFSYDTGGSSGGNTASGSGGVSAPVVGGNLVMDASFAETLAQSMAAAFKGLPASAPLATGAASNVAVSADFGNAFDIIAEEIRTSRASLLDVLKETRNITDTVIASQVSISRVLEGLLASKNRDETDIANLNNKIIASQASITKLLEGLYSASSAKNEEISNYLNVDNKLQDFRNDLTKTIMSSLGNLAEHSLSPDANNAEGISVNIEGRLSAFKNEIRAEVNRSLTEIKSMLADLVHDDTEASFSTKAQDNHFEQSLSAHNEIDSSQTEEITPVHSSVNSEALNDLRSPVADVSEVHEEQNRFSEHNNAIENPERKKKKKKKKKKNVDSVAAFSPVANEVFAATSDDNNVAEDFSFSADEKNLQSPIVGGVIKNTEYKDEDDFGDIKLDTPPLTTFDDIEENTSHVSDTSTVDDLSDILSDLSSFEPVASIPQDEQTNDFQAKLPENLDNTLLTDDLDDSVEVEDLDEHPNIEFDNNQPIAEAPTRDTFDDSTNDDADLSGLDTQIDLTGVDESVSNGTNDLDDFLTEDNPSDKKESDMDDLSQHEALESNILTNEDDDLDFALSNQISANSENPSGDNVLAANKVQSFGESVSDDTNDLDDFLANDSLSDKKESDMDDLSQHGILKSNILTNEDDDDLDFVLPDHNSVDSENPSGDDVLAANKVQSLDDFVSDDDLDFSLPNGSEDSTVSEHDAGKESSVDEEIVPPMEVQEESDIDISTPSSQQQQSDNDDHQSRYSAELDKIREALTSDNIDISSLDEPIALDDYADDENIHDDNLSEVQQNLQNNTADDWEYEYVDAVENENNKPVEQDSSTTNDDDWEWEYVDENGNPAEMNNSGSESDDDWEWEYVEDDSDESAKQDNNNKE